MGLPSDPILASLIATIEIDGADETEALMEHPRIDADIPQYRFSGAEATLSTFPAWEVQYPHL